jgi:hypothetical protein
MLQRRRLVCRQRAVLRSLKEFTSPVTQPAGYYRIVTYRKNSFPHNLTLCCAAKIQDHPPIRNHTRCLLRLGPTYGKVQKARSFATPAKRRRRRGRCISPISSPPSYSSSELAIALLDPSLLVHNFWIASGRSRILSHNVVVPCKKCFFARDRSSYLSQKTMGLGSAASIASIQGRCLLRSGGGQPRRAWYFSRGSPVQPLTP